MFLNLVTLTYGKRYLGHWAKWSHMGHDGPNTVS